MSRAPLSENASGRCRICRAHESASDGVLYSPLRYSSIRSDVVEGQWRYTGSEGRRTIVDALAEKLNARLREWKPETAAEARERIAEVIELADHDILDIARSRAAEQEVLDLLDEPPTR